MKCTGKIKLTDEAQDTRAAEDTGSVEDGNPTVAYEKEQNTSISCSNYSGYNKLLWPLFWSTHWLSMENEIAVFIFMSSKAA